MRSKNDFKKKPSLKIMIFFYTIIFLMLTVMAFLLAERYYTAKYNYVDLLALTGKRQGYMPNGKWAYADAFCAYKAKPGIFGSRSERKTVNKYGFISTPEMEVTKPANTIRIAFLGESSTAGTDPNISDKYTWPKLVADKVQEKIPNKKIEYINGALPGYTSFESYGRLWSRIRYFSPDIIVVYHGWNEMYYFNEVDKLINRRTLSDGSWSFEKKTDLPSVVEPLWIDKYIWPSSIFSSLRLKLTVKNFELGDTTTNKVLLNSYDPRALEVFRTNLKLLRETSKTLNAEIFVCKQATLVAPNLSKELLEYCHFDYQAHLKAFKEINQVIDEEFDSDKVIDCTSMNGIPKYFCDHIHPHKKGCFKIADIVSGKLIPYIKKSPTFNK